MIHPDTELRHVSPTIGHGVFATAAIPLGTIVYAFDQFEVCVAPAVYAMLDDRHLAVLDWFGYIDQHGTRILSWDHAKYVNHRCDCNTMSTGWGFEIAIRDIAAGEEITDEYGLLNIPEERPLSCGCPTCRHVLRPDDLDRYGRVWDLKVRRALTRLRDVSQPLEDLLDPATRLDLHGHLDGARPYRPVAALRCRRHDPGRPRPRRRGPAAGEVAA
jgi:hypothetical protein